MMLVLKKQKGRTQIQELYQSEPEKQKQKL